MLVVHFVRPTDASGIPVIGISEHLKALVDKDVVYRKISDTIGQNTKAQGPAIPEFGFGTQIKKNHAHHGIENKKGIIALKPRIVVFFMVVFM